MPVELDDNEVKAMRQLLQDFAKMEGEDVCGVFMKHGLFRHFTQAGDAAAGKDVTEGIVRLARKFE